MSRLEFDFEPLNKVLDGREITKDDAYEVFSHSEYNSEKIFKVASNLRDNHKGKVVSFSQLTSLHDIGYKKYQKQFTFMEKIKKHIKKAFYKSPHFSQNTLVTPTYFCIFGCITVFSQKYKKNATKYLP